MIRKKVCFVLQSWLTQQQKNIPSAPIMWAYAVLLEVIISPYIVKCENCSQVSAHKNPHGEQWEPFLQATHLFTYITGCSKLQVISIWSASLVVEREDVGGLYLPFQKWIQTHLSKELVWGCWFVSSHPILNRKFNHVYSDVDRQKNHVQNIWRWSGMVPKKESKDWPSSTTYPAPYSSVVAAALAHNKLLNLFCGKDCFSYLAFFYVLLSTVNH